jgi:uncharacterized protein YjbI with pentapeptide repeats
MEQSGHVSTPITSSNGNIMANVNRRGRKRHHTCFEWSQLIATICIPIIIAIYTIIDDINNESNAAADRRKDIEIANISRKNDLEIAQANRLNEIAIAEQSRQKDRDIAIDQQHAVILTEYQTFLANLLIDNDLALNNSPTAKAVATAMTLTALSQLDVRRKGRLIRSLYNVKLITEKRNSTRGDESILPLGHVDLSDITFGPSPDYPDEFPRNHYIDWYYLSLPFANLRNASFRHTALSCANFGTAIMDSVDLSYTTLVDHKCFGTVSAGQTTFAGASLVNASFYKVKFRYTEFNFADLTLANMREFQCMECSFLSAILFQADLTFSMFVGGFTLSPWRLDFNNTNLRQAVVHLGRFQSIDFFKSDWSNAQASQIFLKNCTFTNAIMENCSLVKSNIALSEFQNATLLNIDLSNAELRNVSFINSYMRNANMSYIKCEHCDFTNVKLQNAVLKNASLRHSNFLNCHINASQLDEANDLSESTLPNGTVVKSND